MLETRRNVLQQKLDTKKTIINELELLVQEGGFSVLLYLKKRSKFRASGTTYAGDRAAESTPIARRAIKS